MKGVCLRFYVNEFQKHGGILIYEWLLELAKKNGVKGGSAFRSIAGYGRHGVLHEERFFELASNVPVEVNLLMKKEEAINLIRLIKDEGVDLFYSMSDSEYGTTREGDITK